MAGGVWAGDVWWRAIESVSAGNIAPRPAIFRIGCLLGLNLGQCSGFVREKMGGLACENGLLSGLHPTLSDETAKDGALGTRHSASDNAINSSIALLIRNALNDCW